MDQVKKWNNAAATLDLLGAGLDARYGHYKRELFAKARGRVLLVAAGTGSDFAHFPDGLDIFAIDFSPKMLERAKEKAAHYPGGIDVIQADAQRLPFPDGAFDTVVTSCTFCSVPKPVKGLRELHRVLRPDSQLLMFEHVRPGNFLLGLMMDLMTVVSRMVGPDLNRRTADNIRRAGFQMTRDFNVYLDMVKIFEAQS